MTVEEIIRRLKILWERYLSRPDVNDQARCEDEDCNV